MVLSVQLHLQKTALVSPDQVPLYYALAMGVAGVAGLAFGRLFDRVGLSVLIIATPIAALFAPFVFFGGIAIALLGMVCWGVGMGAHESVVRAAVANFVPVNQRGSAYGIFNAGYGLFWFLGSALIGILYDTSLGWLVIFSVSMRAASIPVFLLVRKEIALSSST